RPPSLGLLPSSSSPQPTSPPKLAVATKQPAPLRKSLLRMCSLTCWQSCQLGPPPTRAALVGTGDRGPPTGLVTQGHRPTGRTECILACMETQRNHWRLCSSCKREL